MQLSFFPSRTLAFYVGKMFLVRTFAVLALLVIVLQTLDLLGESGKILAHPGNGEADLWRYVGLRMPQLIDRFLPFSVLLGTLVTLAGLNQNSEVISMKSAGISAHQVLAPLIVVAAGIAVVSFVFDERIVTRANTALDAWESVEYGPIPRDSGVQTNVWVRDGSNLVQAGIIAGSGINTQLRNVEIFNRNNNVLNTIIRAPRARYEGRDILTGSWVMEDAQEFDVARGTGRKLGTFRFGKDIRPDQFTLSKVNKI